MSIKRRLVIDISWPDKDRSWLYDAERLASLPVEVSVSDHGGVVRRVEWEDRK